MNSNIREGLEELKGAYQEFVEGCHAFEKLLRDMAWEVTLEEKKLIRKGTVAR